MYDSKYSFSNYKNVAKYYNLSFTTKYVNLLSFYHRLNEFRNLVSRSEKTKVKKKSMYRNIATPYRTLQAIYFNDYNNITADKKVKINKK